MSRLFLKIFASFWLAMVLIIGGTGWLNIWLMENYLESDLPEGVHAHLEERMARTARAIEAGTPLPRLRFVHVIGEDGSDLNRRPLPLHLRRHARMGEVGDSDSGPGYAAVTVVDPNGQRFRVLAGAHIPPRILAGGPRGMGLRLLVAIAVSALVCWLLAGYLTRPIRRVRWAAAGLADGELDRRVSDRGGYPRDEIGDLGRDFDRMAERLAQARAARDQLLRDLSHELRSPLARLQVAMELAREKCADQSADAFDRMEQEAERLNALIGDILDLSRYAASLPELERESVSLAALVTELVDDASFEAGAGGRSLQLHVAADATVDADRRQLARALDNVLRNALVHTPPASAVEVTVDCREGQARVQICDRGPGVPADELERIFLPFHRVDRARSSGGHGVGLAIAQAAVQAHGGTLAATSREGGGLCVLLSLPAAGE